jgi:hypothetical protein
MKAFAIFVDATFLFYALDVVVKEFFTSQTEVLYGIFSACGGNFF